MNAHATTNNTKPNIDDHHCHHNHDQLLVDFPARSRHRRQEHKQVHFASQSTVQHVTSVLTMCSKHELWYSRSDEDKMRLIMKRDASELAHTLLSPSDKDLEEGIDISQAVGLDKHVNPIQRRRTRKTIILQRHAVIHLQDEVQGEDELRRISERFSRTSSERAHTLAVHWVGGHVLDGNGR